MYVSLAKKKYLSSIAPHLNIMVLICSLLAICNRIFYVVCLAVSHSEDSHLLYEKETGSSCLHLETVGIQIHCLSVSVFTIVPVLEAHHSSLTRSFAVAQQKKGLGCKHKKITLSGRELIRVWKCACQTGDQEIQAHLVLLHVQVDVATCPVVAMQFLTWLLMESEAVHSCKVISQQPTLAPSLQDPWCLCLTALFTAPLQSHPAHHGNLTSRN